VARPIPTDTDSTVLDRQIEQWRSMSPAERFGIANRLSADVTRLAIAGIRHRHPDASPEDVTYELARRRYGDEVTRPLRPVATS
jgi:hypothetical protein